jgi:hypothetical protein
LKLSTLLLAASIAANVALITMLGVGAAQSPATAGGSASRRTTATIGTGSTVTDADDWATIRSDDLAAELQRLRAENFPPAMIRAILVAQIRARYAAQRKALEGAQASGPYWLRSMPDAPTPAALAFDRQERQALKDLLGPDPESGYGAIMRRQFPNWPPTALDDVAAIRERYADQRSELYATVRGMLLPDEAAKIDALDKAERAEIASVLSPAELEEYNLRTSNTANRLRSNLAAFDPTEAEFRALYKLQSAFDDQYAYTRSQPTDEWMKARSDAQRQLNDAIKSTLGADRYANYQRASDNNFRQTTQLVARLELPPETANQLYAVQQEFQQRRTAIYQNRPDSPEQFNQQLAALQQEALTRVTPLLGGTSRGVDAYKTYGGSWLVNLVPRQAIPAPKP